MKHLLTLFIAKRARSLVRLRGGHGSALPGYIAEKLDKTLLAYMLKQLPLGVVVVTGTNGKTTTTHMLTRLLEKSELRVLTNASGSNLIRGILSTIIEKSSAKGKLDYDIAVFELDEAYAPLFTQRVAPELLIALNVMRDQLDRYGEIDTTARFIEKAARFSKSVLVNGNDNLLMSKLQTHSQLYTFGLDQSLTSTLSTEANLYKSKSVKPTTRRLQGVITALRTKKAAQEFEATIQKEEFACHLPLLGAHNAINAIAAIFATKIVLPKVRAQFLAKELETFKPAFGRGETLRLKDRELTVALIKNPSGFTQNVATLVRPEIDAVLIMINDKYADGRDVSWLWDSDLGKLKSFKGKIFVGGTRRFDMALCLKYQGISYEVIDVNKASTVMRQIMSSPQWGRHLLIIPTYTAMLGVRKWLGLQQGAKRIW